jgi:hypothetical protein
VDELFKKPGYIKKLIKDYADKSELKDRAGNTKKAVDDGKLNELKEPIVL